MFRSSRKRPIHHRLRLEMLERRETPTVGLLSSVIEPFAGSSFTGLTPAIVRQAYGFDRIDLGGAMPADGRGQTIAIISAYDHPTIESDLAFFTRRFNLPEVPNFTKIVQPGTPYNAGWALETALDVQWAHAVAPGANILLVEAKSNSLGDLLDAVNVARYTPGVSVVSMSWGTSEFLGQSAYDGVFTTPAGHTGITFVAASGDSGAAAGTMWPAASANVLSVGGTRLTVDNSGNYRAETAWAGSGGGFSRYSGSTRTVPDVAYAADPASGFLVYNSAVDARGRSGWFTVGGTSAGAPQWAGLLAIAAQGRVAAGKAVQSGAQFAVSKLSSAAFNDVTTGSNGFQATAGYDLATGRGSPVASQVVSQLVATGSATTNTPFIGPLPLASKKPPKATVNPVNGVLLAIAAQASPIFAFAPLPDIKANARDNRLFDPRLNVPSLAPVLLAPVKSYANTSSGRSSNDESGAEPVGPAIPPGDAKPGDAKSGDAPAAAPAGPGAMRIPLSIDGIRGAVARFGQQGNVGSETATDAALPSDGSLILLGAACLVGGFFARPEMPKRRNRRPLWLDQTAE